jgi:hypothetical protein
MAGIVALLAPGVAGATLDMIAGISGLRLMLGYFAAGAFASVPADAGTELAGTVDGAPAAAMLVEDGGAAGCRPAGSTAAGVDWLDGSAGAADRASSDVSSAASFGFHQAHLALDWHPTNPATIAETHNARMAVSLMFVQSRLNVGRTEATSPQPSTPLLRSCDLATSCRAATED